MTNAGPRIKLIIREPGGAWLRDPEEFDLADFGDTLPSVGDIVVRDTLIAGERSYQAYRVLERIFRVDRMADADRPAQPAPAVVVEPITLVESHERALDLPSKSAAV